LPILTPQGNDRDGLNVPYDFAAQRDRGIKTALSKPAERSGGWPNARLSPNARRHEIPLRRRHDFHFIDDGRDALKIGHDLLSELPVELRGDATSQNQNARVTEAIDLPHYKIGGSSHPSPHNLGN
jgi:hypothetical protein